MVHRKKNWRHHARRELTFIVASPGSRPLSRHRNRWYRFAQPPANFCDPSGIEKRSNSPRLAKR